MRLLDRLKRLAYAALVCLIVTWICDREPPHEYGRVTSISSGYDELGEPIEPARPGGSLALRYELLRDRLCPLVIERTIIDNARFLHILPPESYTPGKLGEVVVNRWYDLDPKTRPGPAIAQIDLYWYCNPVHYLLRWPIHTTLIAHFHVAPR